MKAAIYCRLSREDRDRPGEAESIQNQRALLTAYAREQGYDIYQVYWDQDYSGMDRQRPGFQALLRDAQARRFQLVLVKTQSRFTRDMELVERYLHGKFPEWGIRFVALVDGADTQNQANRKSRQINGLVNQWYLEDLSLSVRAVLDHKRRAGVYIASFPLYGYRKDPACKGRLVPDPDTAPVVQQIFALALEGAGARKIARVLNQQGIPCPAAHKALEGISCAGAGDRPLWSPATVSRMLHNRTYAGDLVQGRHRKVSYKSKKTQNLPPDQWMVAPGTHQGLVSRDTFQQVQAVLARRARSGAAGQIHPLARLAVCGVCGSILEQTGAGGRRYLRCRVHQRDPGRCPNGSCTPLAPLEALVLGRIRGYAGRWFEPGALELPPPAQGEGDPDRRAARLQQQLHRRQRALEQLALDRGDGVLSPALFEKTAQALERDMGELEQALALARLAPRPDPQAAGARMEARVRQLAALPALPRALAAALVERILVGPRDPDTGTQPVTLVWKF